MLQTIVQAIFERRKALADVFVPMSQGSDPPQALSLLIKCLQDSLSRLEDFEVKTALQGSSDDRRNSASMLTRQLRFRLVAEDSDVPRSCSNVIVAIHAIATFQAFNEYLRPRISAAATLSGGSGSALAAAFEAAGRLAERDGAASASADVAPESAEVDKGSSRRRSTRLSTKASASDLATAPQEPPGDVSGLQEVGFACFQPFKNMHSD